MVFFMNIRLDRFINNWSSLFNTISKGVVRLLMYVNKQHMTGSSGLLANYIHITKLDFFRLQTK